MSNLHYTVTINAPKQKVWDTMLADTTYRQWTAAFQEGSHYEGGWDEGDRIRFLAPDENGLESGMFSKIVTNVPYEFISIEHLGEVIDGEEDTTSEDSLQWAGAHENYRFSEQDGVTTLDIELESQDIHEELREMFDQMWPPALAELKQIAEA